MLIQRGESGLLIPTPGIQVARTFPATLGGAQSYTDKVLSYSPVAYYPMNETSGTTLDNAEGTAARDGTSARNITTMGTGTGIGDGNTAPDFDGTQDYVDIYSASMNTAFDGNEKTLIVWCKVSGSGVWTDGTTRMALRFKVDSNNDCWIGRSSTNNRMYMGGAANAVWDLKNLDSLSTTGWFCIGFAWSDTGDEASWWLDGVEQTPANIGIGTWSGSLASDATLIGAGDISPSADQLWDGYLDHAQIYDSALSDAAMADLGTL